jgi:DHA1 family bicyclomycin/chloramphenicol resistance-like MFS transporter
MLMCLAIGLTFAGLPLYVGSAAAYVMGILHQPATAFGWLFWPLVGGLVTGSALASRIAHRFSMGRLVACGYGLMAVALAWGLAYTALFTAAVPWAVLPFALYTFGLALASPGMTVMALNEFPALRGLGSALQGFVQMIVFSLVSGLLAPALFHSAFGLAAGHAVLVACGAALWVAAVYGLPSVNEASAVAQEPAAS